MNSSLDNKVNFVLLENFVLFIISTEPRGVTLYRVHTYVRIIHEGTRMRDLFYEEPRAGGSESYS